MLRTQPTSAIAPCMTGWRISVYGSAEGLSKTHHVVHLVRDILQPTLHTLHPGNHSRKFAPNDSL